MSFATSASVITPAGTACAFKQARRGPQVPRHNRMVVRASTESNRVPRSIALGLAAVASVPLLMNGPAMAFVGNTAKDFSDKVEQITPDVNLPGLKQKGKEAEAIGKGGAQGDGAVDQVKNVAEDAKGALKDAKPKQGLFGRIKEEALTSNSPSVQINK